MTHASLTFQLALAIAPRDGHVVLLDMAQEAEAVGDDASSLSWEIAYLETALRLRFQNRSMPKQMTGVGMIAYALIWLYFTASLVWPEANFNLFVNRTDAFNVFTLMSAPFLVAQTACLILAACLGYVFMTQRAINSVDTRSIACAFCGLGGLLLLAGLSPDPAKTRPMLEITLTHGIALGSMLSLQTRLRVGTKL